MRPTQVYLGDEEFALLDRAACATVAHDSDASLELRRQLRRHPRPVAGR